jgi:hypothetical protein
MDIPSTCRPDQDAAAGRLTWSPAHGPPLSVVAVRA